MGRTIRRRPAPDPGPVVLIRSLGIPGPCVVEPERHVDERGFFARTYSRHEFAAAGLDLDIIESGMSFNHRAGTLRGLHVQREPFGEAKLVRCTRGRLWDVAVDVRRSSPCFGRWVALELSGEDGRGLFVPRGFAHGFVTLVAGTEVLYEISQRHNADAAAGFSWDDPAVGIAWPIQPALMSDRDRKLPLLADLRTDIEEHE
jgi:dTDP-4-dehydrorhamnose 3,5-epimerase